MRLLKRFWVLSVFLSLSAFTREEVKLLHPNGGWCWYQDERAIVVGDQVVFGSVKSPEGDIDVTSWNLRTGEVKTVAVYPEHEADDHNVPVFLELDDGRILMSWANHGQVKPREDNRKVFYTRTVRAGSIDVWEPVRVFDYVSPRMVTYTNLHRLSAEGGRIYNFNRALNFNPSYTISEDGGKTFDLGGQFLSWPRPVDDPKYSGKDGGRPYVIYASNSVDTIHFMTTEDHPRAYQNGIWHGVIRRGKVYGSDGAFIAPLSTGVSPDLSPVDLTPVFPGDADHVAWTIDLELDANGYPLTVFSVHRAREQRPVGDEDIRYYYARWDGLEWQVNEMAYAGSALYPRENDYTGLCAIVPSDPNRVIISADVDPATGEPLISDANGERHYEIFAGVTEDRGASWNWEAITENSTVDNLRPVVPAEDREGTILLWTRGELRTFRDYDLEMVGVVLD